MKTQAQLFSNEPAFVNQRACVYKKFVSQSLLHQGQKQINFSCVMPHSALSIILIHIVKILDIPVTPIFALHPDNQHLNNLGTTFAVYNSKITPT
ncbi:MAG: hypothetical protein IJY78_01420 [Bacteroidaceae bacterium]|nr:hypothetical protein [Bacteroidaceae bacterium]